MAKSLAVEAQGPWSAEQNSELDLGAGAAAEAEPVPALRQGNRQELLLEIALLAVVERNSVDAQLELSVVPDLKLIDVLGGDVEKSLTDERLILFQPGKRGPGHITRVLNRYYFPTG